MLHPSLNTPYHAVPSFSFLSVGHPPSRGPSFSCPSSSLWSPSQTPHSLAPSPRPRITTTPLPRCSCRAPVYATTPWSVGTHLWVLLVATQLPLAIQDLPWGPCEAFAHPFCALSPSRSAPPHGCSWLLRYYKQHHNCKNSGKFYTTVVVEYCVLDAARKQCLGRGGRLLDGYIRGRRRPLSGQVSLLAPAPRRSLQRVDISQLSGDMLRASFFGSRVLVLHVHPSAVHVCCICSCAIKVFPGPCQVACMSCHVTLQRPVHHTHASSFHFQPLICFCAVIIRKRSTIFVSSRLICKPVAASLLTSPAPLPQAIGRQLNFSHHSVPYHARETALHHATCPIASRPPSTTRSPPAPLPDTRLVAQHHCQVLDDELRPSLARPPCLSTLEKERRDKHTLSTKASIFSRSPGCSSRLEDCGGSRASLLTGASWRNTLVVLASEQAWPQVHPTASHSTKTLLHHPGPPKPVHWAGTPGTRLWRRDAFYRSKRL